MSKHDLEAFGVQRLAPLDLNVGDLFMEQQFASDIGLPKKKKPYEAIIQALDIPGMSAKAEPPGMATEFGIGNNTPSFFGDSRPPMSLTFDDPKPVASDSVPMTTGPVEPSTLFKGIAPKRFEIEPSLMTPDVSMLMAAPKKSPSLARQKTDELPDEAPMATDSGLKTDTSLDLKGPEEFALSREFFATRPAKKVAAEAKMPDELPFLTKEQRDKMPYYEQIAYARAMAFQKQERKKRQELALIQEGRRLNNQLTRLKIKAALTPQSLSAKDILDSRKVAQQATVKFSPTTPAGARVTQSLIAVHGGKHVYHGSFNMALSALPTQEERDKFMRDVLALNNLDSIAPLLRAGGDAALILPMPPGMHPEYLKALDQDLKTGKRIRGRGGPTVIRGKDNTPEYVPKGFTIGKEKNVGAKGNIAEISPSKQHLDVLKRIRLSPTFFVKNEFVDQFDGLLGGFIDAADKFNKVDADFRRKRATAGERTQALQAMLGPRDRLANFMAGEANILTKLSPKEERDAKARAELRAEAKAERADLREQAKADKAAAKKEAKAESLRQEILKLESAGGSIQRAKDALTTQDLEIQNSLQEDITDKRNAFDKDSASFKVTENALRSYTLDDLQGFMSSPKTYIPDSIKKATEGQTVEAMLKKGNQSLGASQYRGFRRWAKSNRDRFNALRGPLTSAEKKLQTYLDKKTKDSRYLKKKQALDNLQKSLKALKGRLKKLEPKADGATTTQSIQADRQDQYVADTIQAGPGTKVDKIRKYARYLKQKYPGIRVDPRDFMTA